MTSYRTIGINLVAVPAYLRSPAQNAKAKGRSIVETRQMRETRVGFLTFLRHPRAETSSRGVRTPGHSLLRC